MSIFGIASDYAICRSFSAMHAPVCLRASDGRVAHNVSIVCLKARAEGHACSRTKVVQLTCYMFSTRAFYECNGPTTLLASFAPHDATVTGVPTLLSLRDWRLARRRWKHVFFFRCQCCICTCESTADGTCGSSGYFCLDPSASCWGAGLENNSFC